MRKDKFNMPRTVADTLLDMRDDTAMLRMAHAIINYGLDGILPDFSGDELALFEKLRAKVDAINGGERNGKR